MEQILRRKEMAEIILLPVRHHSPACAWHIVRMIEKLKPDAVLIEGPENAGSLIPAMIHEETKAPFAVYYSYQDQAGEIGGGEEYYKCYYPFLDYSPELAALRTCRDLGIPGNFMDLPTGRFWLPVKRAAAKALQGTGCCRTAVFFRSSARKPVCAPLMNFGRSTLKSRACAWRAKPGLKCFLATAG